MVLGAIVGGFYYLFLLGLGSMLNGFLMGLGNVEWFFNGFGEGNGEWEGKGKGSGREREREREGKGKGKGEGKGEREGIGKGCFLNLSLQGGLFGCLGE